MSCTGKYILENIPSIPRIRGSLHDFENALVNNSKADSIFNHLLNEHGIRQKKGFYELSGRTLQLFLKSMDKIQVKSTESTVYTSNFISRKIPIIIKIPKKAIYHDGTIRAYYIGTEINKLKNIVPNFIYTLGIFITETNQVMVAYEYIKGESLEKVIKKLSFQEFLNIFIQILLALEIAQRNCSFCHYDLHLNNVIMKPISQPYSYTVVIDNKRYDIVAEKYIPIIIDFGLASAKIKNKIIGSYDYFKYGIMNYLIPGSDMYKFLFHSYARSNGDLQRQISSLFLFYGVHDPYKILIIPQDEIAVISKQYLKAVSTSEIAIWHPLKFLKWISFYYNCKLDH